MCAREITIAFDGQKVLDEVSFSANAGQILAILGGNGAGKSTLCRVVTGLYKQNVGQVLIDGQAYKKKQRVRETFFVQQDSDYQLYAATVEDEFYIGKKRKSISRQQVLELLHDIGLGEMLERHPLSLSGGQKQRLLLALAVASGKEILVLDEPTSGLDGQNMRLTAQLLRKLALQGKCILLITHDLELIDMVADSMVFIDRGKVVYQRKIDKKV